MLEYPEINPVAFHIGPVAVHWYGLMYLLGFAMAWALLRYRGSKQGWTGEQVSDLIFYAAIGVVLGGRLGYVLFYNLPFYLHNPLSIFKVWDGGMSFHGGFIGVIVVMGWLSRKWGKTLFAMTDFIAPVVPLGLAAGRLGNFINGELWGRVTTVPWGMVYPNAGPLPRHPSELYEFLLEGILLFAVLWLYSMKPKPRMAVSGLFLLAYGCIRFLCECFRQPDPQLGFVALGWVTMGQVLSIPMILLGMILLVTAYRRNDENLS